MAGAPRPLAFFGGTSPRPRAAATLPSAPSSASPRIQAVSTSSTWPESSACASNCRTCAQIAALDEAEKPALIIMDGVGIGMCVYQDLVRQGLKHIMPSGSMQKENVGSLKTVRFHATVPALYDGLVRIPNAMPGLETLLSEFAALSVERKTDARNDPPRAGAPPSS